MTSEELFEEMCSMEKSRMGPNTPKGIVNAILIESSIMTDTLPVRCDLTEVSGVSKF